MTLFVKTQNEKARLTCKTSTLAADTAARPPGR